MAYEERGPDEDAQEQVRKNVYRDKYKNVTDLKELCVCQKRVQERKTKLEEDLKEVNAEFDVLRFERVPEQMENDGVESGVRFTGIGQIVLLPDLRIACNKAQKPGFFAWLKKRRMGDLVQEDINSSTLKAWVKERMKTGKELPPSDLVRVEPVTKASIRKG